MGPPAADRGESREAAGGRGDEEIARRRGRQEDVAGQLAVQHVVAHGKRPDSSTASERDRRPHPASSERQEPATQAGILIHVLSIIEVQIRDDDRCGTAPTVADPAARRRDAGAARIPGDDLARDQRLRMPVDRGPAGDVRLGARVVG
jgi:hypothetical protein